MRCEKKPGVFGYGLGFGVIGFRAFGFLNIGSGRL